MLKSICLRSSSTETIGRMKLPRPLYRWPRGAYTPPGTAATVVGAFLCTRNSGYGLEICVRSKTLFILCDLLTGDLSLF